MDTSSRGYIAIGDIHGCAKTLKALLNTLDKAYGGARTYVFLGDYVDRGPESKQVIDQLIEFSQHRPCEFIRGNHDQMLLNYYADKNHNSYSIFEGRETLESYRRACKDGNIPFAHLRFLINTRFFLETDLWVFVHGGLPPTKTIRQALNDESQHPSFLWMREHLEYEDNEWEKTVVFGHTPMPAPLVRKRMIGIDTGCVYPDMGKLTAVLLPEVEFIQKQRIDF